MSALLLRFKANYLEKILANPYFPLWIQTALAKIWNFWSLSEYKLAGNEIFLRHENSGDWG